MLVAFLDYYRETICSKLEGVTDEGARWIPAEGANSLIGIVNHLAYVEDSWFHQRLLGLPSQLPNIFENDPDAEFRPAGDQSVARTIDQYRRMWQRSNEITQTAGLDDVAQHPKAAQRGVTLRWILVHMLEETARHAGHMDITRQLVDGATGD